MVQTARGILLRSDAFPAVPLVAPRCKSTVDLRDHGDVGVAELPRDELVRRPRTHGADCVEVPRVVDPVVRQPQRAKPFAMRRSNISPIEPEEESFARR